MAKKLIVFDWGQVLEGYNTDPLSGDDFLRKVLSDIGMELSEEALRTFRIKLNDKVCLRGTQTKMNFHIKTAFEHIDILADTEMIMEFRKSFIINSLIAPSGNKELIDFIIKHSVTHDVDFALLSNCSELEKVRQSINAPEHLFKYIVRSCDVGLAKPEAMIYSMFEQSVPYNPKNILFIDDNIDNLSVPRLRGWNTYFYKGDNEHLIDTLEQFIKQE